MANAGLGYEQQPENSNGIIRARTTQQLRAWQIPRTINALEKWKQEICGIPLPGNYILFDGKKVYIGETQNIYQRLKSHIIKPEPKIKGWDTALIFNDARIPSLSDFNENDVRLALESYLIRLFKANKYKVLAQAREASLSPMQKHIVNLMIKELDYLLLSRNIIYKVLEDQGLEEIHKDALVKLFKSQGKKIEKWSTYDAVVDGQIVFIRPGSEKSRGWQITFRDLFLNALKESNGYLLVSRNGVLYIPLKVVQKVVKDKAAYKQNTIDVYIVFETDKVTLSYKDNSIDVTEFRLIG